LSIVTSPSIFSISRLWLAPKTGWQTQKVGCGMLSLCSEGCAMMTGSWRRRWALWARFLGTSANSTKPTKWFPKGWPCAGNCWGTTAGRLPTHLLILASILERQGKLADAEPLARECLAIYEAKNTDYWRVFEARSLLGATLLAQKKYADAEPLLLSGYEGMKQREDKAPKAIRAELK